MQAADREALDAHFTVDKQNISLWPREPSPKPAPSPLLREPVSVRAALICLSLVLAASVVLQAVLYPWFMGRISDVKTDAQLLKDRVGNISSLGSEVRKNGVGVQAAGAQIHTVNASLDRVYSQILTLKTSVERASAQIQILTESWEEVHSLNARIPELKSDLDKASTLHAKVRGLQSSLENISEVLRQQNDILQMVYQGWKYFKGNFYYFSRIAKTWYSAQQFCMSRDSHLTSVTSESEQEFLYKTAGGLVYWIGLSKAGSEGHWYWADGTSFNEAQSVRGPHVPRWPVPAPREQDSPSGAGGWEQHWRMKDMKMSSDTVRFCTDDQGVFLNPQGADSMAVAPAALRIPRHLQATLAFVAVAVVSSLVALFVVDHCIFGEIDEVKEAFQMFKSHMENCSTSQREIQMLMCRVNDVRSQLRVLCGDYPGNTSTDVQTKKGSLWATSVDNTSAEIQVLRGHWEGAASDIHLLKGELETVTAQTRLAIGHLGQIDGQLQVLKAQLEDVNGLNSQIQVLGGQLNNASREIETLRQGMQAAEALGSKTQALESGLKQASAEIQRLRGDLESTRALTGGLAEQQSRLETLSAAVASQERLQKNQTQLLQLFLQGWKLDRGNLYYFSHVKKSWHEAEQFCASHGAHLASVTSEEEQAFLRQFTSSLYHWIGLTDSGMEGSWRWTDGTPFSSSRSTTRCPDPAASQQSRFASFLPVPALLAQGFRRGTDISAAAWREAAHPAGDMQTRMALQHVPAPHHHLAQQSENQK
nr:uncharacterized protein LOC100357377 isoform X1 [Oryctolagus cuniculus]